MAGCLVGTIRRAGAALALTLALAPARGAGPTLQVSLEDYYTALMAPCLADDGRISAQERQTILATARKLLTQQQFLDLETRLATLAATPTPREAPALRQVAASDVTLGAPTAGPGSPATAVVESRVVQEAALPLVSLRPVFEDDSEGLFDNLTVFGGLDGSKQPQDLGINAHFGGRFDVNWAFPLWKELGLGAQVGTGLNYSYGAVHVLDQISSTSDRLQSFTTVGLFQRTSWGLTWAVGHDFLAERYYDHFFLSQWRGLVGYAIRDTDEVGVWYAVNGFKDKGTAVGTPVTLEPISQVNLYWKHLWPNLATTTAWAGASEGHSEAVFVFPGNPRRNTSFVFGAEVNVPLNNYLSLYGAANFIAPARSGTVDAYLGLAFYPGGRAREAHQHRFAAPLPVANNPQFAVDFRR